MLTKLYVRTRTMLESDEGATAVEYGLMVALIAVAIIGMVALLGENLSGLFEFIAGKLEAPTS